MNELLLPQYIQQIMKMLQILMSTDEMLDIVSDARFYKSEYNRVMPSGTS